MSRIFNFVWAIIALTTVVGCSSFEGETIPTTRPTTIHFTADIEEQTSRAYFDENGTDGYTALWSGEEAITVVALDSNRNTLATATTTMQIDAERGTASFDATFDELPATTAYLRAYANRDNDLAEQYMRHDGEVAMRLTSDDVQYVAQETLRMTFTHDVAYGRMTLNLPTGVAATDIVKANITIDDKEYAVRINNSALESPVVWFSAEEDNNIEYMRVAFTTTTAECYERVIGNMQSKNEPLELTRGCISRFKVGTFVKCESEVVELDSSAITHEGADTGYSYLTFEDDVLGYISLYIFIEVSDFSDIESITMGFGYNPNEIYNNSGRDTSNTFWRPQGSTTQYALTDGSVTFTTTADNKYEITMNVLTSKGNTITAHYLGTIEGVDLRTYLSWPENPRTTVNGKQVTVAWDAVNDAVGYEVYCSTAGAGVAPQTTTALSATFDMPEYSTTYEFRVKAIAERENTMYKDSGYNICTATTDKDPFADYVMTTVTWNDTSQYFLFSNDRGEEVRLYLNESDRPNNNAIMAGTYSYAGYTGAPAKGSFGLNRTTFSGEVINATRYDTATSTMTVDVVDGKYRIVWSLNNTYYNKIYKVGFIGLGDLVLPPAATPSLTLTSESLTFEAAGGEEQVTVTLENSDAEVVVSCDNAHFGYELSGSTLRITAPANSATEEVTGTVTVTAGTLSRTIALRQAAAESGNTDGGDTDGDDTGGGDTGGDDTDGGDTGGGDTGGGAQLYDSWCNSLTLSEDYSKATFSGNGITIAGDLSAFRLNTAITLSNVTLNGTSVSETGTVILSLGNGNYIANLDITIGGNSYKANVAFNL